MSVLRPGTFFTCRPLTSINGRRSSSRFHPGFQYTPVDSIAATVAPWPVSQSPRRSSSLLVVPNFSMNCRPSTRTQAHTESLCTSRPTQRRLMTSNGHLLQKDMRPPQDVANNYNILLFLLHTAP